MVDVNQTRAQLHRRLAGSAYQITDTPRGTHVTYGQIQDSFAADTNQVNRQDSYGLNIEFRPRQSWAEVQRSDPPRLHGPLSTNVRITSTGLSRTIVHRLTRRDDPRPVRQMVELVTAVLTQNGWRLESPKTLGRNQIGLIIGLAGALLAIVVLLVIFVVLGV